MADSDLGELDAEYSEPVYFAGTQDGVEDELVDLPSDVSVEEMKANEACEEELL